MSNQSDISRAAAALGSRKTEAKAKAARENGAKGGRPRQDEVLARTYVISNGQQCEELLRTVRGTYLIAVNGGIPDARQTLSLADAQAWYDDAGIQVGDRPE